MSGSHYLSEIDLPAQSIFVVITLCALVALAWFFDQPRLP